MRVRVSSSWETLSPVIDKNGGTGIAPLNGVVELGMSITRRLSSSKEVSTAVIGEVADIVKIWLSPITPAKNMVVCGCGICGITNEDKSLAGTSGPA
jgi:hypothetical protein